MVTLECHVLTKIAHAWSQSVLKMDCLKGITPTGMTQLFTFVKTDTCWRHREKKMPFGNPPVCAYNKDQIFRCFLCVFPYCMEECISSSHYIHRKYKNRQIYIHKSISMAWLPACSRELKVVIINNLNCLLIILPVLLYQVFHVRSLLSLLQKWHVKIYRLQKMEEGILYIIKGMSMMTNHDVEVCHQELSGSFQHRIKALVNSGPDVKTWPRSSVSLSGTSDPVQVIQYIWWASVGGKSSNSSKTEPTLNIFRFHWQVWYTLQNWQNHLWFCIY